MSFFLVCSALVVCASVSRNDPDEGSEPYPIRIVEFELRMRSGRRKMIHAYSLKELHRLGDAVSIALVKLLGHQRLTDPEVLTSFLPIVQAAFAHPDLVSRESDRHPRITLLLLNYLRQNVPDLKAQKDIQQTEEFVRAKTTE